ncbi:MAG TPA: NAD(P)-dependent oxidoreductase [Anaeromyxobacteraceae bacterium]|nr:NAD(P)-dependent oxidoreductase [Anaeromyxobacteraceae bacterium]
MKVLVTGPFGNVGTHLLPELLREGHEVRCLARDIPRSRRAARGQFARTEVIWGDVRDPAPVGRAVEDVEAVVHLAALIPPGSEDAPLEARAVNVGGTENLLRACAAQPRPPRLLFTSSLDVHGRTQARPPPRHVDDPLVATDEYTANKIACEERVRASGLAWCILRLSDVPVIGLRDPHPIMFEIGLHNRIEAMHADDAAVALARALRTPEVWGRTLFVGGGPSCQVTYREYLRRLLAAMGIEMLPDEAFSTADYATDWLDTEESQRLLRYQRRSFEDICRDVAACLGWKRRLVPLAGPLVRSAILGLSPYWAARAR